MKLKLYIESMKILHTEEMLFTRSIYNVLNDTYDTRELKIPHKNLYITLSDMIQAYLLSIKTYNPCAFND